MLEITTISSQSASAANVQPQDFTADQKLARLTVQSMADDQVELSSAARDFVSTSEASRITEARIQELRARIAQGTYLTPDKLDDVIDRLHAVLFGAMSDVA
ncbi:MAG: flagellar biosynthesis anti-sigma factor FlgM [Planctomycetota bacterium]